MNRPICHIRGHVWADQPDKPIVHGLAGADDVQVTRFGKRYRCQRCGAHA